MEETVVTTQNVEAKLRPAPAAGGTLLKEEMLQLECFSLKASNLRMSQERLQADLIRSTTMLQELAVEVSAFHKNLSGKYGVDLAKVNLHADGSYTIPSPAGDTKNGS